MKDDRVPSDYPLVSGEYEMTDNWTISLPGEFRRRFEDGSLVLWRPGLTAWITIWKNDHDLLPRERFLERRQRISPDAYDVVEETGEGLCRFSYRLDEGADDARVAALYAFVFGSTGDVQMGIYFNTERDLAEADALWRGVRGANAG
jgi:hypothetical protein